MVRRILGVTLTSMMIFGQPTAEQGIDQAVKKVEEAIKLVPDVDNGRKVYLVCAVCHMPEGWGTQDGYYPQVAG